MNIAKLQQEIKTAEESLARMKEQLKESEQKNDKDFYPESKSCKFVPEYVLKVVDEDRLPHQVYLACAFSWEHTPQGHDYWSQKQHNKSSITDEDKITLLRWVVNYYRSKVNHGT